MQQPLCSSDGRVVSRVVRLEKALALADGAKIGSNAGVFALAERRLPHAETEAGHRAAVVESDALLAGCAHGSHFCSLEIQLSETRTAAKKAAERSAQARNESQMRVHAEKKAERRVLGKICKTR